MVNIHLAQLLFLFAVDKLGWGVNETRMYKPIFMVTSRI